MKLNLLKRNRQSLRVCFVFAVLCVIPTTPASAAVQTIREFLSKQARWPNYAKSDRPTRLIIEGRYDSRVGRSFRFQKCDIRFECRGSAKLPIVLDKETRLEVSGFLKRSNGRYTFIVERLRTRPSDRERLDERRKRITTKDPDKLIQLGKDTISIAEFYEDTALLDSARKLFAEAVKIRHEALKRDDETGRRTLVKQIAELGLPAELADQYRHEAIWIRWTAVQKDPKADLNAMLKQVVSDFPGADKPMKSFHRSSYESYLRQRLFIYARSSPATRKELQRYLYMHVLDRLIAKKIKPDHSNGFAIAREYEQRLPERKDIAENLREKELQWREGALRRLSKIEMRELVKMHVDRGDQPRAKQVLEEWFTFHDTRMRQQGPAGLITLGDDYLNELNDRTRAATAFQEAWSFLQEPTAQLDRKRVESKLEKLGWIRKNDAWVRASESGEKRTITNNNIQVGMQSDDVLRALGAPTQRTRIAGRNAVSEIWLYSEAGLSIVVKRNKGGSATVVGVSAAPG